MKMNPEGQRVIDGSGIKFRIKRSRSAFRFCVIRRDLWV